ENNGMTSEGTTHLASFSEFFSGSRIQMPLCPVMKLPPLHATSGEVLNSTSLETDTEDQVLTKEVATLPLVLTDTSTDVSREGDTEVNSLSNSKDLNSQADEKHNTTVKRYNLVRTSNNQDSLVLKIRGDSNLKLISQNTSVVMIHLSHKH
ncbi:hypothetical protein HAX54_040752, partial [Datura stramonium]|nr:hypothetical protein [Datura stramonium]